MSTEIAFPNNTASTFLTHLFASGLADDRYVVERFRAYADGDIRPWPGEAPAPGRRGAKPKRVEPCRVRTASSPPASAYGWARAASPRARAVRCRWRAR